jgi:hypothetical protein
MVVRAQALVCALVAAAALAPPASGHGIGAIERGYVSNVSHIQPAVLGLEARVLGGHDQLSLRNWSRKRVVIMSLLGRAVVIAPGATRALHDHRIGWYADEAPGVVRRDPGKSHYVRAWRVPGTADGKPFVIHGYLGYAPPSQAMRDDRGWIIPAAIGAALVALLAGVVGARRMRRAP